jgi:hypothetical protein
MFKLICVECVILIAILLVILILIINKTRKTKNIPKNPGKLKRMIYLLASTILGLLLSFIAHALIEINYLELAEKHGLAVPFYHGCAIAPILQIALWVLGAVGGFCLGHFWWRKIYIERVCEKRLKK